MKLRPPEIFVIDEIILNALHEDLGQSDITTDSIVSSDASPITAELVSREAGVLSGIETFERVFDLVGEGVDFSGELKDGDFFNAGDVIRIMSGNPAIILKGERVALNFLQHMCGIATLTSKFCKKVEGTNAKITCTRKTLPGLRLLEKYAVRCGGGKSHRFNLSDAILVKDNHIALAGGIKNAVALARENAPHNCTVEVEVENLDQFKEGLASKADIIMVDNFESDEIRAAVDLANGEVIIEASGGVSLDTVRQIAECGVDFISVGRLTHSAPATDISLEFAK